MDDKVNANLKTDRKQLMFWIIVAMLLIAIPFFDLGYGYIILGTIPISIFPTSILSKKIADKIETKKYFTIGILNGTLISIIPLFYFISYLSYSRDASRVVILGFFCIPALFGLLNLRDHMIGNSHIQIFILGLSVSVWCLILSLLIGLIISGLLCIGILSIILIPAIYIFFISYCEKSKTMSKYIEKKDPTTLNYGIKGSFVGGLLGGIHSLVFGYIIMPIKYGQINYEILLWVAFIGILVGCIVGFVMNYNDKSIPSKKRGDLKSGK